MRNHTLCIAQPKCMVPQNGRRFVAACAGLGVLTMLVSLSVGGLQLIAQEPSGGGAPTHDSSKPPASDLPQVKPPSINPFVQQKPATEKSVSETPASETAVNETLAGASPLPEADPLQDFQHTLEEHVLLQEQAKAKSRARFESGSLDLIPKWMPAKPTPSAEEAAAVARFDRAVDMLPPPGVDGDETGHPNGFSGSEDILSPSDRPLSQDRELLVEPERESSAMKSLSPRNGEHDSKQAQSVLEISPDMLDPNTNHWTGLIEDERNRWPAPASHRPYQPVGQVTCSGCGGCVDRHGVGFYDKIGVRMGIGTRENPACQCWRSPHAAPFNLYGPGGYAGPARSTPLPEYRLRAGDQVQLTFLIRTVRTVGSYRLVVGDELLVESDADPNLTRGTLDRGLEIQPDGTLTLRFIGQVHAAGQTIEQLRDLLNERYEEFYPDPAIDVTPVRTGNVARQIREAISGSEGFNPQQTLQTVTPEGTLRLPRLGAIPTQGLTMGELKREINLRYESLGAGLEVEVMLQEQAPHYVYVLGEVTSPGRFAIDAPTTVLGSLSMAGSYVPGANLRQVVVFRRGPNWELLSTVLDLRAALLGQASQPPDEIWIQDGDVIIVPPAPIRLFDRFVQQVFTEGIYGIVPFGGVSFSLGSNNR